MFILLIVIFLSQISYWYVFLVGFSNMRFKQIGEWASDKHLSKHINMEITYNIWDKKWQILVHNRLYFFPLYL